MKKSKEFHRGNQKKIHLIKIKDKCHLKSLITCILHMTRAINIKVKKSKNVLAILNKMRQ